MSNELRFVLPFKKSSPKDASVLDEHDICGCPGKITNGLPCRNLPLSGNLFCSQHTVEDGMCSMTPDEVNRKIGNNCTRYRLDEQTGQWIEQRIRCSTEGCNMVRTNIKNDPHCKEHSLLFEEYIDEVDEDDDELPKRRKKSTKRMPKKRVYNELVIESDEPVIVTPKTAIPSFDQEDLAASQNLFRTLQEHVRNAHKIACLVKMCTVATCSQTNQEQIHNVMAVCGDLKRIRDTIQIIMDDIESKKARTEAFLPDTVPK